MEKGITIIPIEEINILNPRVRNKVIAEGIKQNIREVGLKRPITVTPRKDGKKYDLVCGQGRLEAFIAVGATNSCNNTQCKRRRCPYYELGREYYLDVIPMRSNCCKALNI